MCHNKNIAIIPARSGSKGLIDKNIKELNHKPLLAYTIEAAKKSGLFETIHVSTDSEKYSKIAENYGADQPFLRHANNSADASSTWDAVREVIENYEDIGKVYDIVVLLQPTSPLRTSEDIQGAYSLFQNMHAKTVVSVTEVDHPIQWCFTLDETKSMKSFAESAYKNSRRQDLQKHYRENGAIYIIRTKDIMNPEFEFYNSDCYAYIMDRSKSIDIDSLLDFKIAEIIMKEKRTETFQ